MLSIRAFGRRLFCANVIICCELVIIYATTKETHQFLINSRFVINLFKNSNLGIRHDKQLNYNKANEI